MTARARFSAITDHLRTPLYRDAYALIVANGMTAVIGLGYWGLAARFFTPGDLGAASALISMLVFLSAISQLNLRVALLRFIPEAGSRTGAFILLCYGAVAIAGLAVGIAFIATMQVWVPNSPMLEQLSQINFALFFVASIVVWSFFNMQDGLLTGLGQAIIVPFENGLYGIAKLALLVVLATWTGQAAVFVSWTLPAAFLVVAVSLYIARRLIPAHTARTGSRRLPMTPRALVRFMSLDYVASLFATTTIALMPVIVVSVLGATNGGYFYIPWVIITTMMLIPQYTVASFTVQAVDAPADIGAQARQTLIHVMRMIVPLIIGLMLFAPLLLEIFGPKYADEGTAMLRLGLLGLLPMSVNVLFLGIARVQRRGRAIVTTQATLTIVTLVVSITLLPSLGIVSVGGAWLAANSLVAAYVFVAELRPLLRAQSGSARS